MGSVRWSIISGAWEGRRLERKVSDGRRIAFAAHLYDLPSAFVNHQKRGMNVLVAANMRAIRDFPSSLRTLLCLIPRPH